MPFNAGGFFQRLFNWRNDRDAGIKILAERMDKEMDGIVAGINDIVSGEVDWKGPMTGVFGTAAAPAYSFREDPDTGIYRISADVLGFSAGGAKKAEVTATGLNVSGSVTASSLNVSGTTTLDWANVNDGAGSGADADLPDGLHATAFLRSDAANPSIRMGPADADNWHGIRYDDAENSFKFFTDQNPDTDTPILTIDKETGLTAGTASVDTLKADTVNEKTSGSGVNIDSVRLRDGNLSVPGSKLAFTGDAVAFNDYIGFDATANTYTFYENGNATGATLVAGGINANTINEATSDSGVTIDGVLLKGGTIQLGDNDALRSVGSMYFDIDIDSNSTSRVWQFRDNGATRRVQINDDGYTAVYRQNGGACIGLYDEGASSANNANPYMEFRYATTVGGSTTRLGYIGFASNWNENMYLKSENGDIDINGVLISNVVTDIRLGSETIKYFASDKATSEFYRANSGSVMTGIRIMRAWTDDVVTALTHRPVQRRRANGSRVTVSQT